MNVVGKGKGRGSMLLMKQLSMFESRTTAPNEAGMSSSSLIDYAFVAGPNTAALETAFGANSKSRGLEFLNHTSVRAVVDPELLFIEHNAEADLEVDALPSFCFPAGIEVIGQFDKNEGSAGLQSTPSRSFRRRSTMNNRFTLSSLNLTKYTPTNQEGREILSRSQSFVFMLQNHTSNHFGVCLVLPRYFRDEEKELTVVTNYCLCLVSEYPYFSFLIDALQRFNMMGGFDLNTPIEKLSDGLILHHQLQHFHLFASRLKKQTVGGMGRTIEVSYVLNQQSFVSSLLRLHGPQKGINLAAEKDSEICYHTMLWGLPVLLSCFPLDQIILALGCVLTEMKIIVVSSNLKEVSACILCLLNLIRPLKWSCPVIVTCPDSLLGYLEAPCPIILGLQKLPDYFSPSRGMAIIDLSSSDSIKNCVGLHFDDVLTSHTLNMPLSGKLIKLIKPDVDLIHDIYLKSMESTLQYSDGHHWDSYFLPPELDISSQNGMNMRSAISSICSKVNQHLVTIVNTAILQDKGARVLAAQKRELSRIRSTRPGGLGVIDHSANANLFNSLLSDTSSPPHQSMEASNAVFEQNCFSSKEVSDKGKIFIKRFLDTQMYSDYNHRLCTENPPVNAEILNLNLKESLRIKRASVRLSGDNRPFSSDLRSSPLCTSDLSDHSIFRDVDLPENSWTNLWELAVWGSKPLSEETVESMKEYYAEGIYPPNFLLPPLLESTLLEDSAVLCSGLCYGQANTILCSSICKEIWSSSYRLFPATIPSRHQLYNTSPAAQFNSPFDFSYRHKIRSRADAKKSTFKLHRDSEPLLYRRSLISFQHKKHDARRKLELKLRRDLAAMGMQKLVRRYLSNLKEIAVVQRLHQFRRGQRLRKFRDVAHQLKLLRLKKEKNKIDDDLRSTTAQNIAGIMSSNALTERRRSDIVSVVSRSSEKSGESVVNIFLSLFKKESKESGDSSEPTFENRTVRGESAEIIIHHAQSSDDRQVIRRTSTQIDDMRRHLTTQRSVDFTALTLPPRAINPSLLSELIPQQKRILFEMYETLIEGIKVLKYNARSRPKIRYLYCDAYLTRLYWRRSPKKTEGTDRDGDGKYPVNEPIGCFRSVKRREFDFVRFDLEREIFVDQIMEVRNSVRS